MQSEYFCALKNKHANQKTKSVLVVLIIAGTQLNDPQQENS